MFQGAQDQFIRTAVDKRRRELQAQKLYQKTSPSSPTRNLKKAEMFFRGDNRFSVILHPKLAIAQRYHTHEFFEIIYVYAGSCTTTVDGEQMVLKAGDLLFLNIQTGHVISVDSWDDIVFNILIKPDFLEQSLFHLLSENDVFLNFYLESLYNRTMSEKYLLFQENTDEIASTADRIVIEYLRQDPFAMKVIEAQFVTLVSLLARENRRQAPTGETIPGKAFVPEILQWLSNHYAGATLKSTAEHFHYTTSYLSFLIKEYTGKNFLRIIQDFKIREAERYLKETSLSVERISDQLGYKDAAYFCRVFKNTTGATPSEYRRSQQENSSR